MSVLHRRTLNGPPNGAAPRCNAKVYIIDALEVAAPVPKDVAGEVGVAGALASASERSGAPEGEVERPPRRDRLGGNSTPREPGAARAHPPRSRLPHDVDLQRFWGRFRCILQCFWSRFAAF